jgi:hypothetical protein
MTVEFDLTKKLLGGVDGIPIRSSLEAIPVCTTEGHIANARITRTQWLGLSRRVRRMVESGRARITTINEVHPLEFARPRRRSR